MKLLEAIAAVQEQSQVVLIYEELLDYAERMRSSDVDLPLPEGTILSESAIQYVVQSITEAVEAKKGEIKKLEDMEVGTKRRSRSAGTKPKTRTKRKAASK